MFFFAWFLQTYLQEVEDEEGTRDARAAAAAERVRTPAVDNCLEGRVRVAR